MKKRKYRPQPSLCILNQAKKQIKQEAEEQEKEVRAIKRYGRSRLQTSSVLLISLSLLVLLLCLLSCRSQAYQTQVPIVTKEKIIERLVPYALPADSSAIEALFECDSLNNVRLIELSELKAKGLQSQFSFYNGLFKYNLNQPPDTVYIPAKDSIITREVPIEIPKEVPVNYLTKWQIIQTWFGKIFMGLLGLGLIIGVTKWKLKR